MFITEIGFWPWTVSAVIVLLVAYAVSTFFYKRRKAKLLRLSELIFLLYAIDLTLDTLDHEVVNDDDYEAFVGQFLSFRREAEGLRKKVGLDLEVTSRDAFELAEAERDAMQNYTRFVADYRRREGLSKESRQEMWILSAANRAAGHRKLSRLLDEAQRS